VKNGFPTLKVLKMKNQNRFKLVIF